MHPDQMRAVALPAPGPAEAMHLARAPVPQPRPGEVLIHVAAAGINRPDIQQRRGLYPPPPDASPVLGLEVAGEIVSLGVGVTGLHPGARVCALVNGGGYAEYCVAPATQCLPLPAGYDFVRAAALPETFFTVWANLFMLGRLAPGETALVHGGGSGIGTTAIQLARASGARVAVTAGSAEKCAACVALGADRAIDYKNEDFVDAIAEFTDGRGADVILDMVGGAYLSRNIQALARGGRLVVIALQGGTKDPAFDLLPVMTRRLTVTGSTMRPRSAAEKGEIAAQLRRIVWPWLDDGSCAPVIDRVFAFDQVVEAHRRLEQGSHFGKIVLNVRP